MSVTTTLAACSQTPSANGPDGAVDPPSTIDDAIRYSLSFIAQIRDTYALSSTLTGANVIINSDYSVSQYNGTSLLTPANNSYPIDMWKYVSTQASKVQFQQVLSTLNSIGGVTAGRFSVLSTYSPISTDNIEIRHAIEGFNFSRFLYGTVNAQTASLQFKARASVSGTYSGSISNYALTRSYPFSFTLAANTDTLIQIQAIPGDTGGTWIGATNAGAALLRFNLGSGTNFQSTANSWQSGDYAAVTGTTQLTAQTVGSTLTISDVQLELGSTCSKYEKKLFPRNLSECQRYLQILIFGNQVVATGQAFSTTTGFIRYNFPVQMRSTASVTLLSGTQTITQASGGSASATFTYGGDSLGFQVSVSSATGLVAGNAICLNSSVSVMSASSNL